MLDSDPRRRGSGRARGAARRATRRAWRRCSLLSCGPRRGHSSCRTCAATSANRCTCVPAKRHTFCASSGYWTEFVACGQAAHLRKPPYSGLAQNSGAGVSATVCWLGLPSHVGWLRRVLCLTVHRCHRATCGARAGRAAAGCATLCRLRPLRRGSACFPASLATRASTSWRSTAPSCCREAATVLCRRQRL